MTYDEIYAVSKFVQGLKGWGDGCNDCRYDIGVKRYDCEIKAYDHGRISCEHFVPSNKVLKKYHLPEIP